MLLEINRKQFIIGMLTLSVGAIFYVLARPTGQTYFVSKTGLDFSFYDSFPALFILFGNSLPTFIHVFSFILLTASLFYCSRQSYFYICLFWLFVDSIFELGQRYGKIVSEAIPGRFASIPFLENCKNYFLRGSFDLMDIVSIFLGTLSAYLVLLSTTKVVNNNKGGENENRK